MRFKSDEDRNKLCSLPVKESSDSFTLSSLVNILKGGSRVAVMADDTLKYFGPRQIPKKVLVGNKGKLELPHGF